MIISDQELVDNWFAGKYASNWHRGKNIQPQRSAALEGYLLEKWLPAVRGETPFSRNGGGGPHGLVVARWMNDLWARFKDREDKPWMPGNRNSGRIIN